MNVVEGQIKMNLNEYKNRIRESIHSPKRNTSLLSVINSSNCNVCKNIININYPSPRQEMDIRKRFVQDYATPYREILSPIFQFKDDIVTDPLQREIQLINTLHHFQYFLRKNREIKPTVRIYGSLTGLSTFRQPSDTSDLACLELEEKKGLIDLLIKTKCRIKIICTLDIEFAYYAGYTCEQFSARIEDMCKVFRRFERYQPFSFVIDDLPSPALDNIFIFDTSLLVQSSKFKPGENYSLAVFSSDKFDIKRAVIDFDTRYDIVQSHRSIYNPQTAREYIYENLNRRLEQLPLEEEKMPWCDHTAL